MRRTTHNVQDTPDELVVFHIGMRINKPWRIDAWLPTFFAMPPMIRELSTDPDSGLLGHRLLFGERGATVVMWFDSVAKLYAYANDSAQRHRPAWLEFLRRSRRAPGAVGIWHETYHVARAETFYGDTPNLGLGRAVGTVPITRHTATAGDRIGQRPGRAGFTPVTETL